MNLASPLAKRLLVTGSNGLIGQALCPILDQYGYQILRAVRTPTTPWEIQIGEIGETTNWDHVLDLGVDVVIHLAAQVPQSDSVFEQNIPQYFKVNTLGTAHLARRCAVKGVKRFIFVSTVKVLGEGCGRPYQCDDLALPTDIYAISKWEAEQSLKQIAMETGMEVVVLRPPLVYGPGVKGNFFRLMHAVDHGLPLPFGAIHNQRSLIYLGNLVDAIKVCVTHPSAAGKTYMVSDGDDVSTPELIRRVATALGRSVFLLPVPINWMKLVAKMLGRQYIVERLVESLAVNIQPILDDLNWTPPYSMQSGLALTVEWYRMYGPRK